MRLLILPACLVLVCVGEGDAQVGPMHNSVQVCTADTSGWIRRGIHLRQRGDCQQGYICDGDQIQPFRAPCREPSYMSVHTGTCSFPNIYAHVFSSFNCTAEEDDPNLDYDFLNDKRMRLCEPMMSRPDEDTTELYVGDPDDCRQMFKCPLVAAHDDWLHMCPPGFRFEGPGNSEEGVCFPDLDGCGLRSQGRK